MGVYLFPAEKIYAFYVKPPSEDEGSIVAIKTKYGWRLKKNNTLLVGTEDIEAVKEILSSTVSP